VVAKSVTTGSSIECTSMNTATKTRRAFDRKHQTGIAAQRHIARESRAVR
jgi:hypothetical protein